MAVLFHRRPLLLAGLVLLLGLIGSLGVRGLRQDPERKHATKDPSAGEARAPETRDEGPPSSRRKPPGAGSAEAKLKSLLAVREGEMAFIRVPAALMGRLGGGIGDGSQGSGGNGLGLMGLLNRKLVLDRLTGHAEGIEGTVDASDESFEWRGPRMQVSGTGLRGSAGVTLTISATEGGNELMSTVSLVPGTVVFLHSSPPDPEGVLIVIGKNEPGAGPGDEGEEK